MKRYYTIVVLLISTTILCAQQPKIWVKGNAVIQRVSDTLDARLIPEGENFPSLAAINFNPALKFDGENDALLIPFGSDGSSQYTVFTVVHPLNTSVESGIWGVANTQKDIMLTTHRAISPNAKSNYNSGNTNIPVLNSMVQYWGANLNSPYAALMLGNTGKPMEAVAPLEGYLAEYMLFNRALPVKERERVQSYLALKYGITITYHHYRNSDDDIIWNKSQNEDYAHHIASIGHDEGFTLHQKQARSTAEFPFLIIGAESITETNADNTTNINDKDFLIWGDNGASYTDTDVSNDQHPKLSFIKRKWLMSASGSTAHTIPTELQLNIRRMSESNDLAPMLVIDRSGEGDFTSENLEFIPMSELATNGFASFKNIKWDTDNSGKDAFTFAVNADLLIQDFVRGFTVYPNPSVGNFSIDILLEEAADAAIKIYDAKGAQITNYEGKNASEYRFNQTLNLPSGVYSVTLETNDDIQTKQIVINR